MAAFGIFAALCIITNLVLALTLFPCAVLIHDRYIIAEDKCFRSAITFDSCCGALYGKCHRCNSWAVDREEENPMQDETKRDARAVYLTDRWETGGWLQKYLSNFWLDTIIKRKYASVMVVLLCIYAAVSAAFALSMQAPSEPEKFFGEGHMVMTVLPFFAVICQSF